MNRTAVSSLIPLPQSFPQRSLLLASLNIGRVLADRDGVTFRAQGTCMYPTVRPGDVLRLQSRPAAEVVVGDIAVCRAPDFLFGHRVIDKGERDGRAFIITRPDRVRAGNDAPTFDENLLGVVVTITRQGKPVPLQPTAYPWPVRRYLALRLALLEAVPRALLRGAKLLASVQEKALYRRLARGCLVLARPRVSYTVRLPMPALGDAVYHPLAPETFDVRMDWRGGPVASWTLALHLNGTRQPAAWARIGRGGLDAWRVEESFVRLRYRGAGLDDTLMRQAKAILARSGMALRRMHE
jgi:hypothetical protein